MKRLPGSVYDSRQAGFSLVEVLVAMTVFALMGWLLTSMTSGTIRSATLSRQRLTAEASARQVFDRIGADLARALLRSDLRLPMSNQTGNDELRLFSRVNGYAGDRRISEVVYRINPGQQLVRAVGGSSWTGNSALKFHPEAPTAFSDADMEQIGDGVFRFEVAFLMEDGSVRLAVPGLGASRGAAASERVAAVVVTLAILEEEARLIPEEDLQAIGNRLADAQEVSPTPTEDQAPWRDLSALWSAELDAILAGDLPQPVRQRLRIYHQTFVLAP